MVNNNEVDFMDYDKVLSQKFNGVDVLFGPSTDNDVMIFVTDVVQLFPGKRINNFLRSQQTQELIDQIANDAHISASQVCYSTKGNYSDGRPQGTWMRRELALAFAMWLDPVFYLWCLQKLIELLTQGSTSMNNEWFGQASYSNSQVQDIINQLQQSQEENKRLQEENHQLQQHNQWLKQDNFSLNTRVNAWQPQVNYYNQVLNQKPGNCYTTKDILVQIKANISSKDFIKMMINNGIAHRTGKSSWQLKSPYCNQNLRDTFYCSCADGNIRPVLKWTEAGKHFVWMLAEIWKLI